MANNKGNFVSFRTPQGRPPGPNVLKTDVYNLKPSAVQTTSFLYNFTTVLARHPKYYMMVNMVALRIVLALRLFTCYY